MRNTLYILLLAWLFAACTADDGNEPLPVEGDAVSFGAYAGRYVSGEDTRASVPMPTRAYTGNLGLADLRQAGFGVIAYYTGDSRYASGQTEPNFMYNQKVADSLGKGTWDYQPVKYWPNNGGYVSYFAYAPHTGTFTGTGVTALTANTSTSEPTVSYALGSNGDNVDLLWGTDADGKPLTDRTPDMGRVAFHFSHALTKIGGMKQPEDDHAGLEIKLKVDSDGNLMGSNSAVVTTKVTIRSIEIEQIGLLNTTTNEVVSQAFGKGTFNLNTGEWTATTVDIDTTGNKRSPYRHLLTVADSVAAYHANGSLDTTIAEPTAKAYSTDRTLPDGTPRLMWENIPRGVTTEAKSVYGAELSPMLLIPQKGYRPVLRLTVSYVIRSLDPWLIAGHTEIKETLTRTVTLTSDPLAAHRYHIVIELGMHDVSLSGDFESWTVSRGSIIHNKRTQQDTEGPDIINENPSNDDLPWMAKKRMK